MIKSSNTEVIKLISSKLPLRERINFSALNIECEKINFSSLNFEFNNKVDIIETHITSFIKDLSVVSKLQIILCGLKKRFNIDHNTLHYESIDTICEDIIVQMLLT